MKHAVLRPVVAADAAAVTELVVALESSLYGASTFSQADLQDAWSDLDLEQNARVVCDGARIVGYGVVREAGGIGRAEGYVHPDALGCGIGTKVASGLEEEAARRGAHVVFHPHFHEAEPGGYRPTTFADPRNTFHEKAMLCRAAENTVYFASANCASEGAPSTSAIVNPDGTLLAYQPYGQQGLLIADIDLGAATGRLAQRLIDTRDSSRP